MKKAHIKYIINRTIHEVILHMIYLIDFILPDLTVFSILRRFIRRIWIKVWKNTRIRKWQYCTYVHNLSIWNNCFINRGNLFDNTAKIEIWDNCSIWYENKFLTTAHYEQGHKLKSDWLTTYAKSIKIWNNVWIASSCIILPWVCIWDNCIIWSWAVVTWNCDSWWIYVGVPAKRIRETEWFISKAL